MDFRRKAEGELEASEVEYPARKRAKLTSDPPRIPSAMQMNGDSSKLGLNGLIKRRELVMLIEQALSNLGFTEVSEQLAEESGIKHETATVTRFREGVLEGDFDRAVDLLDQIGDMDSKTQSQCRFLIMEQKFLEDLEQGAYTAALRCLQDELGANKSFGDDRLHQLAGCMLCTSPEALREHLNWPGSKGNANRLQLLRELQELMPPEVMMPEGRLEELLEQALTSQWSDAEYSSPAHQPVSLLTDYCHHKLQVPTQTCQVLTDHTEEVWHIQFSHNGRWLASASKDCTAIVWEVVSGSGLQKRHTFQGHSMAVTFCCWSPCDTMLATCSLDGLVKIWDVHLGCCSCTIDLHQGATFTASWHPDGEHILTSGEDKRIYMSSIYNAGAPTRSWRSNGVNELVAFHNGMFGLLPYGENKIELWHTDGSPMDPLATHTVIKEQDCIVSFSISRDQNRVLLNMANRALHLWCLPRLRPSVPVDLQTADLVQVFTGASERHSRFVVRSCFGGPNDCFILSGSEECKVFVWHAMSGDLLAALEGHSGTVNSVSWNPVDHNMFASASDDRSIHVWGLDTSLSGCSSPRLSVSSEESLRPNGKSHSWQSTLYREAGPL